MVRLVGESRLEDLRTAWFDAPDQATQKKVAEQIQLAVWDEVPYYPLGQWFQPIARRKTISGIVRSAIPIVLERAQGVRSAADEA